jgi:hypothetical protein
MVGGSLKTGRHDIAEILLKVELNTSVYDNNFMVSDKTLFLTLATLIVAIFANVFIIYPLLLTV